MVLLKGNVGTLLKLLTLLLFIVVLTKFWGEAILIAIHLINKILSFHTSSLLSFEKLYNYAFDYFSLRVFDCTCFVFRPHTEHSKLYVHSVICVFLGYGEGQRDIIALIRLAINYMFLIMFSSLSIYLSFFILVESHKTTN